MTTFNVTIPDDKTSFFLEFIELIGGKYESEKQAFQLSDEQKEFLLRQNKISIKDCISVQDSYQKLKIKYGL